MDDGAWGQHGEDGVHEAGPGGAHWMRGDGVGIGHIGEMQGGPGGAGVETSGGDGREGVGEPDGGVVSG